MKQGARGVCWGVVLLLGATVARADGIECPDGTLLVGQAPPDGMEQQCVLPDGTPHGPWVTWYPNGQRMSQTTMHKGREHGEVRAWYPSGQLMMRAQSVYGKRYRDAEYWDRNGNPRRITVERQRETVSPSAPSIP